MVQPTTNSLTTKYPISTARIPILEPTLTHLIPQFSDKDNVSLHHLEKELMKKNNEMIELMKKFINEWIKIEEVSSGVFRNTQNIQLAKIRLSITDLLQKNNSTPPPDLSTQNSRTQVYKAYITQKNLNVQLIGFLKNLCEDTQVKLKTEPLVYLSNLTFIDFSSKECLLKAYVNLKNKHGQEYAVYDKALSLYFTWIASNPNFEEAVRSIFTHYYKDITLSFKLETKQVFYIKNLNFYTARAVISAAFAIYMNDLFYSYKTPIWDKLMTPCVMMDSSGKKTSFAPLAVIFHHTPLYFADKKPIFPQIINHFIMKNCLMQYERDQQNRKQAPVSRFLNRIGYLTMCGFNYTTTEIYKVRADLLKKYASTYSKTSKNLDPCRFNEVFKQPPEKDVAGEHFTYDMDQQLQKALELSFPPEANFIISANHDIFDLSKIDLTTLPDQTNEEYKKYFSILLNAIVDRFLTRVANVREATIKLQLACLPFEFQLPLASFNERVQMLVAVAKIDMDQPIVFNDYQNGLLKVICDSGNAFLNSLAKIAILNPSIKSEILKEVLYHIVSRCHWDAQGKKMEDPRSIAKIMETTLNLFHKREITLHFEYCQANAGLSTKLENLVTSLIKSKSILNIVNNIKNSASKVKSYGDLAVLKQAIQSKAELPSQIFNLLLQRLEPFDHLTEEEGVLIITKKDVSSFLNNFVTIMGDTEEAKLIKGHRNFGNALRYNFNSLVDFSITLSALNFDFFNDPETISEGKDENTEESKLFPETLIFENLASELSLTLQNLIPPVRCLTETSNKRLLEESAKIVESVNSLTKKHKTETDAEELLDEDFFVDSLLQTQPIVGIANVGNSCYMNASIQALLGSSHFVDYLESGPKSPFGIALKQFILDMQSNNAVIIKQKALRFRDYIFDQSVHPEFIVKTAQQDAEFFVSILMEAISCHITQRQYHNGTKDDKSYSKVEDQIQRLLSIEIDPLKKGLIHDLQDLLSLSQNQTMNDVNNIWNYEEGDVVIPFVNHNFVRTLIGVPPPILSIQLKRFVYDAKTKRTSKNMDKIKIANLDKLNLVSLFSKEIQSIYPNLDYNLVGCVIHKGDTLHHGHYVALSRRGEKWVHFDDEKTTVISGSPNIEDAYILVFAMNNYS